MTVPVELQSALGDRYELERELGRGGMATVYLANDRQHSRRVAVKVLDPTLRAGQVESDRFHREIRVAANLVHPGIVPLFDSGECNGHLYYVMPFIDSETLADRLAREGTLSTNAAIHITTSLARALDYAHRRGIVHRDIKPANIFLHEGEALLADFGVARAVSSLGLNTATTTAGFAVGTPNYMSPEQAVADRDVDGRSDQYSLACVLFEMLAGQPPFVAEHARQVIMRHVVEPPPSIRRQRADVSGAIEVALVRALAKAPAERFGSTGEFAAALTSRAVVGDPIKDGSHAVAVLPFVTVGGEADTEYLSDGLTDELISALARVDGLRVTSRTSAFAYKGRATDVRRIGSELQVADVIEGTVRRSGRRLRVTARLTNATDGTQRTALRFDRDTDDLFALEDELAAAIVDQLRPTLLPTSVHVAPRRYTDNADAYRLYLRGRFAWNKRTYEDTAEAIQYFEQAIAEDPTYALAYSGLSDAHALQLDYRNVPVAEGMARAKTYARKALELDEGLAEAHASLGWVLFIYDWEWQESLAHFERAVAISPNYATARQWYSFPLVALGQFERSLAEVQMAVDLDPASVSVRRSRGGVAYYARRYDDAVAQLERAAVINPTSEETHRSLGFAFFHLGEMKRAERSFREGLLYTPESPYSLAGLAGALHRLGRENEARDAQLELKRRASVGYVSTAAFAMMHGLLGNVEEAIDWLEKARDERRGFVAYIGVNPTLDPLRQSPRFNAIVAALGLDRASVGA
ncbi:MAG: protein kinase domain-containing protein [Gemmatimonadaceae bacterium]